MLKTMENSVAKLFESAAMPNGQTDVDPEQKTKLNAFAEFLDDFDSKSPNPPIIETQVVDNVNDGSVPTESPHIPATTPQIVSKFPLNSDLAPSIPLVDPADAELPDATVQTGNKTDPINPVAQETPVLPDHVEMTSGFKNETFPIPRKSYANAAPILKPKAKQNTHTRDDSQLPEARQTPVALLANDMVFHNRIENGGIHKDLDPGQKAKTGAPDKSGGFEPIVLPKKSMLSAGPKPLKSQRHSNVAAGENTPDLPKIISAAPMAVGPITARHLFPPNTDADVANVQPDSTQLQPKLSPEIPATPKTVVSPDLTTPQASPNLAANPVVGPLKKPIAAPVSSPRMQPQDQRNGPISAPPKSAFNHPQKVENPAGGGVSIGPDGVLLRKQGPQRATNTANSETAPIRATPVEKTTPDTLTVIPKPTDVINTAPDGRIGINSAPLEDAPKSASESPDIDPKKPVQVDEISKTDRQNPQPNDLPFTIGDVSSLNSPQTSVHQNTIAPRPELATHIAHQITDAVKQSPNKPIELSLHPQELGHVRITLQIHDGSISVLMAAQNADTTDLMRRHIDVLAQKFNDIGFENINFSFEDNTNGSSGFGADKGAKHTADFIEENISNGPAIPAKSSPVKQNSSGLDVRI